MFGACRSLWDSIIASNQRVSAEPAKPLTGFDIAINPARGWAVNGST